MEIENKKKIIELLKEKIKDVNNVNVLVQEKNIFNKNFLTPLYSKIKSLSNDDKKIFGTKLNELKNEIDEICEKKINDINKKQISLIKAEYDLMIPVDSLQSGSVNPIQIVANDIMNFFKKFNFEIVFGDEVTSVKYNFDNLNIQMSHPARSYSDTFYIDDKTLLRVHCTAVTAKMLEKNNQKSEIKVVSFGNVYRKDDDDATHSHQFNQIDFVWVNSNMSISNLKWLIDELLKYLFNEKIKTRYRLSHFPFTEPSMEVDISCFMCDSKGCSVCKKSGWIEILGAGLLHPSVLASAEINPEKYSGIAAGFGLDRIAMLKYGISDIRYIYENDFRVLSQFRGKN